MKTLTIAFPAKFQIHARFAMILLDVVEKLRNCQTEWIIKTKYLLGKSNLSHARSVLVTEWFETSTDEDGFFFIDTDHTFTEEDILRVIGLEGDLNAGIYCNRSKDPTCFPLDPNFTDLAENIHLKYAATGFLFFRKKALLCIHEWMKINEGLDRVMISDYQDNIESRIIPFFHAVIEPPRASDGKRFWLGEDYSFSYRAFHAGLKIRGCISNTLGHEIPYVVFNDKPRRSPVQWLPMTVAIYCGNQTIGTDLLNQCRELVIKGYQIVLYSKETKCNDRNIYMKRYEEFHITDLFTNLVMWDIEDISYINTIQAIENTYIMLNKRLTSLPISVMKAKMLLFSDETLKLIYNTLLPAEKLYVGPLQNVL
jgi:hypothetical protein